jgi:hypothetical protein
MAVFAVLIGLTAQLLAQPAFWYCIVALMCANIISHGIRRGLRAHAVVLRRRRFVDDDDVDEMEESPRAADLIPTYFDEQAFDRVASRPD